ncbi:aminotransferase class III-fold pyridoxal phosphate-dependent enzyme [Dactylosporangium sp. NPDC000555]|uniref:aminotransferase class III-fold pyridoxal phosphate-dependent enzyme n=1 Tax=Dactylosporangium sp. NPDC000555 TaxID=3154260 RepID=UPI00331F30EA
MVSRQRLVGRGAVEVGSDGAEVRLSDGRVALDFGSYAVPLFGHRPPHVVRAVHEALDTMPTSTRLLANPYAVRFGETLTQLVAPARLDRVWLGLNGSDVVEAALKLAIARTGRPAVLAVEGGFHGKTMAALAATSDPPRRQPMAGFLGDVRHLPPRADAVAEAARERPFAALILEPVQGEGGGRVLDPALLRRWSQDAHRAGAFVIADEIQCGLRRCGPVSVAVAAGAEPDAVLFGKPLGGGVMPLSAVLATESLYAPLAEDAYFHTATFSGHPLSCAAGIAALELLAEYGEQFAATAAALRDCVEPVLRRFPDVLAGGHTTGLFGVLTFATLEQAGLALLECARRGLLLAPCLTAPAVLRLLPPVVTSVEQFERAAGALRQACEAVRRKAVR